MPVHAEMTIDEIAALRQMLAGGARGGSLAERRSRFDGLGGLFPVAPDVELEAVDIEGVPAEWSSAPGARKGRVVLFLHGGGYGMGSIKSHRHLATEIGRSAQAAVLALDYRLAPEAPFPAAVDDALAAYRHLLASGIDPEALSVVGDSAGGGLAVALLLAARDAGLPQPACAVCLSPWVDLELDSATMETKAAEDPIVQEAGLHQSREAYLGDTDPRHPLASPLHGALKGIAPLLILVDSAETLLGDAVRLAEAAGAAAVPVRLEIWPEMIHVWPMFHPMLAEGRRALTTIGRFITEKAAA